ncbi:MAG: hypothetical protein KME21_09200 [Desmonostoc vinosum HA7617-LM4]|jgi:hypothetical protein|nr:hypothetical protein [Desmonostoc vinosum HA7617-LM4]
MRAAISLLVSSLVFDPLALNCQAMFNHFSYGLLTTPTSEQLLSTKPTKPTAPHRGSGRREENLTNPHPAV